MHSHTQHSRSRFGGRFDYVFEHVAGVFGAADLAVVNLESPLLPSGSTAPAARPGTISLPGDAAGAVAMRKAGIKLVRVHVMTCAR